MMIWNLTAIGVNTVSIFFVYYECAFHMRAVEKAGWMNYLIELILAAEVLVIFFKSYPARDSPRGFICSLLGACGLCKKRCLIKSDEDKKKKKDNEKDAYW